MSKSPRFVQRENGFGIYHRVTETITAQWKGHEVRFHETICGQQIMEGGDRDVTVGDTSKDMDWQCSTCWDLHMQRVTALESHIMSVDHMSDVLWNRVIGLDGRGGWKVVRPDLSLESFAMWLEARQLRRERDLIVSGAIR